MSSPAFLSSYSPLAFFSPLILPGLGLQLAPNDNDRSKASAVMKRIGTDLLKKSKVSHEDNRSSGCKDIISGLVQANTMENLSGRMPDEDVLHRVY